MSRMVDEPYFTYSTYSALTSGIQVLTDRAIREGLQHLRPGNEYDNLYLVCCSDTIQFLSKPKLCAVLDWVFVDWICLLNLPFGIIQQKLQPFRSLTLLCA